MEDTYTYKLELDGRFYLFAFYGLKKAHAFCRVNGIDKSRLSKMAKHNYQGHAPKQMWIDDLNTGKELANEDKEQ